MVTHGAPGDTFWDIIRKGAEAAAAKDNVKFQYSSDPDSGKQATLIQSAIDAKVDGIAVTLPDPPALAPAVKKAVDAGIPVVAFNAGIGDYAESGALSYFGSDESLAGEAAGKRASEDGYKNLLCVIQFQGQVQLEARCDGVKKTFTGNWQKIYVNGADRPSVQSTIAAKLKQDPNIDFVVTLGAPDALAAMTPSRTSGSSAKVGTFDFNPQIPPKINSGELQFAIDQQPYLQGYLVGRFAVALQEQRQHPRRRAADADRAVHRRQVQHRRRRQVRGGRHPVATSMGGRPPWRPPTSTRDSEVRMSQTVDIGTPPAPTRDERVARQSPLARLMTRPEIGALAGAIVIYLIFFIVAPPFRDAQLARHRALRQLHLRHPGGRGGAAHDRRGVRPVGRRRRDQLGAGRIDDQLPVQRQHVGRRRWSPWSSRWRSASSTATWW